MPRVPSDLQCISRFHYRRVALRDLPIQRGNGPRRKGWRHTVTDVSEMKRFILIAVVLVLLDLPATIAMDWIAIEQRSDHNPLFIINSHVPPRVVTIIIFDRNSRQFLWVLHSPQYLAKGVQNSTREF